LAELLGLGEEGDRAGYEFCYVPEHYLNAVYGPAHPVADAWIVAAGIAARTKRIRVVTAVQPGFKAPGVVAKMGATIAAARPHAFGLSILAGWWRLEAEMHGDPWLPHAERYRRAAEYLEVIRALWSQNTVDLRGRYFQMTGGTMAPRPNPAPIVFVAGESEPAIDLAARLADYLFINGGDHQRVQALVAKVKRRALERYGRPVRVALSAFAVLRDTAAAAERAAAALLAAADLDIIRYFDAQMDEQVVAHNRGTANDRIEANLGLTTGLVGDRDTIIARIRAFERAGVDAIVIKCEAAPGEPSRFYREVIARLR
jgi:FMNH2-dependent dimethyl sulfone monooxygenase